ncbi:hypothetical protein [Flavobacterium succinicans]|uniref:Uncharacterized protein n=1 Tax=Flavobacterium succinicans TaxID=29536 RepID=A0A199XSD3_9FLAO|nr:hypothetical protein [Flavobacterium succinicans]OAZ04555.1 hypothetical protein FLB_10410 [Flavobacterium succinicans]
MDDKVNPTKRFFLNLKDTIKQWFYNDEPINNNLSLDELLKSFIVIIPIHGNLYLCHYYLNFGISYFLYFNPIDFVYVFYSNNIKLLTFSILIGFLFIQLVLNFKTTQLLKIKPNILLSGLFLFTVLLSYLLTTKLTDFYILLISSFLLFGVAIMQKQSRITYYALIFLYFAYTIKLAYLEAAIVKKNKPNFTIVLNDKTYALQQDTTINHKDYFIGRVTDYIFVYNDSIKSVRVVPISEVKEIQFH